MTISGDELMQLQEFTSSLSLAGADNDVIVQCVGYHEETDEYEYAKFATLGDTETASKVYSVLVNFPALAAELLALRKAGRWIPIDEDPQKDGYYLTTAIGSNVYTVDDFCKEGFDETGRRCWKNRGATHYQKIIPPEAHDD